MGIHPVDMETVKKALVGCLIAGSTSLCYGFETRTLQFDVPNGASFPPTFPPPGPNFTPAGEWNTVNLNTAGLLITTPGLQIPQLNAMFSLLNVPANLQGSLERIDIRVETFARLRYIVDNEGGAAPYTVNLVGTITVKLPTTTAPGSFPGGANFLSLVASDSVGLSLSADDPNEVDPDFNPTGDPDFLGPDSAAGVLTDTATGTDFYDTNDAELSMFNGSGVVYLPISFSTSGTSTTSGNFAVSAGTFGAALVTVTYTFVPESDLAWGGLPLVAGGWLIRRRMMAGKKA